MNPRYVKQGTTTPEMLLVALKELAQAQQHVAAARAAVSGRVKVRLIDDLLTLDHRLHLQQTQIDDAFWWLFRQTFGVDYPAMPLLSDDLEAIARVEKHLVELRAGQTAGRTGR